MNQEDRGKTLSKARILIAPLDWGLGHATRVIPLIRELIVQSCEPVIASSGATEILLRQEFPNIEFVELEGYDIQYSKSRRMLPFKILNQVPAILEKIKKERRWLRKFVELNRIDAVISDNRFGLYHDSIPTVFITHQLMIRTSLGSLADQFLQRLNYGYIRRFTRCWVPDMESIDESLAGELSHPRRKPSVPIDYIGPLSRFNKSAGKEDHLLIVLSGPEPQRTMLEDKLISQLQSYDGQVKFVRGLPGHGSFIPSIGKIEFFNHLPSNELNELMSDAGMIISRSGYSTVMDIHCKGKKSILIPTPGQPEQEYLGVHLMKTGFALCISQKEFKLDEAILRASKFDYKLREQSHNGGVRNAVRGLLSLLGKK